MKNLTSVILAVIIVIELAGCGESGRKAHQGGGVGATQPVNQGSGEAGELMQDVTAMAGYGAEAYRKVYEKDEIVSVLKNGMTVIVKRVGSPVVSVRCYVGTGGVYEGQWLGGGLSHLLEHLVAGGSNARRTEEQNKVLLQQIGNNSNAYTTYDHTAYFINTTSDHLENAVDLVTGWVLTASITKAEYAREYQVVQRELEMDKGNPDWVYYELTQRNRYFVSPARVPVIGYQEVIQGLSRDDVYNYYKKAYQTNNMIFAVAGDFEPEKMLQAVQKYVANAKPGREFSHDIAAEPAVTAPRTLVCTFPKLGQAKLELGFPSVQESDPDVYAMDLFAAVLAKGESSLLVQEIRDKKELVTGIAAGDNTPQYVDGTFTIDMELPTAKISEATAAVLDQIDEIKKNGIDEERLKRAKTQMATARAFGLQTSEDIASSMATDYLMTDDPHFSDRYVERIQKVTSDQIKEVANKYFKRNKLITTAMLPAESPAAAALPKASDVLRAAAPTTAPTTAPAATPVVRVALKNNTVLLVKRIASSPVVVMNMYAIGGLTAEDEKTNGLGSLAMDVLPRGTKTRNAEQIAQFFDSVGGALETSSGNNYWSWQAACLKADFGKTIEVFADIVENPAFPESEFKQVQERTLAAIEAQDADWFNQSQRFFRETYFGPRKSAYQFLPIGTTERVKSFNVGQAREWYEKTIGPAPRVLAIYGDVDVAQVKELAEKFIGAGKEVKKIEAAKVLPYAPSALDKNATVMVKRVAVNKTSNPHTGILIGYDSSSVVADDSSYPLTLAKTMASGFTYPTGYLFETLRGRGLTYDVNSYNFPGRDEKLPGAFVVYAGCEPKVVNEVIDLILENVARLQGTAEDLQPEWFDRSKKLITTADAMDHETAAQQAQTAAIHELFGLGYDYHDKFADKIGGVKLSDVQAIARMKLRQCVVTVNTSEPDLVTVKEGERRYASFPPVDLTPRGVQHDVGGAK